MLIIFTEFTSVETRYDMGFIIMYIIITVCGFNIIGVFLSMSLALRHSYLKSIYDKAWGKYHIVNDKIVNFI
jgi:hypothetical protein